MSRSTSASDRQNARRSRALAVLVASALAFAPRIAQACAVCFSGRSDETRVAFIATTAFLTLLPMVLIGGVVWWLRRRAIAIRSAEIEARAAIH